MTLEEMKLVSETIEKEVNRHTKRLQDQNAEFVQQRNTAMQRAYNLARALKVNGPFNVKVSPAIWQAAELAITEMNLAQGIGTYQYPR